MNAQVGFLQAAVGFSLTLVISSFIQAAEPKCACKLDPVDRQTVWSPLRADALGPSPELRNDTPRLLKNDLDFDSVDAPLQVVVPERLLNRLLATERTETGRVRDVIANTDVVGQQTTVIRVQADCQPNSQRAEIHLVLQGEVYSDTMGVTRQATVNTLGKHTVVAIKPVMFDGRQLSTRRPQIWVDVHSEHVSAATTLDGLPIFGGIARGTALSTAERLRPQADAETADHLSAQVGPQFNQEADLQLAHCNRMLKNDLLARFSEFWPTSMTTRSTDSHVVVSGSWDDTPRMIQSFKSVSHGSASDEAVTVRMHESVLNSALQRLPIAGKTFSERELQRLFESFVTQLGGQVLTLKDSVIDSTPTLTPTTTPALMPMIRFADRNAMRVKLEAGQLLLVVNASVEIAGNTVLTQDEITMPLTWKNHRNAWQVDPGKMTFAKADQGISLVGMMESLARTQLANAIPATLLPQAIALPSDAGSVSSLRVASVKATDGWLTLLLSVDAIQQPVPEGAVRPTTIIRAQSPSANQHQSQTQLRSQPVTITRIETLPDRRFKSTTPSKSVSATASKSVSSKDSQRGSQSSRTPATAKSSRESRDRRDPTGWFE